MTKQEAVIKYIEDNYLQFRRLRHDIVSDKLQIRMEADLEGSTTLGASVQRSEAAVQNGSELWREMTKHDINSIVCHCAQEYDANITSREVITALQSDLIPNVHPLREYILSLRPYTPDQPDWIDMVASQVRVRESATDRCEAPVDRHFVAVDGRSAAPVVFHNESTASNASELQCSASDIDRTRGAVDRAEPCRSAAPEDRPTGCSVSRESTASITSDLQCSASETNYSEPRERSKADALWRICFKKWFVAMVASWMKDEVVNHQVLVLIGKQGIYKTTWLEHLIPPHLRAYACKLANSSERILHYERNVFSFRGIEGIGNTLAKNALTAKRKRCADIIVSVNTRAAESHEKRILFGLTGVCANRAEGYVTVSLSACKAEHTAADTCKLVHSQCITTHVNLHFSLSFLLIFKVFPKRLTKSLFYYLSFVKGVYPVSVYLVGLVPLARKNEDVPRSRVFKYRAPYSRAAVFYHRKSLLFIYTLKNIPDYLGRVLAS